MTTGIAQVHLALFQLAKSYRLFLQPCWQPGGIKGEGGGRDDKLPWPWMRWERRSQEAVWKPPAASLDPAEIACPLPLPLHSRRPQPGLPWHQPPVVGVSAEGCPGVLLSALRGSWRFLQPAGWGCLGG